MTPSPQSFVCGCGCGCCRAGVPHIYATDELGLYFLLGVVHAQVKGAVTLCMAPSVHYALPLPRVVLPVAQDRTFQLEVLRRIARAKMSEFVGEKGIFADELSVTLGWERLAKEDMELFKEQCSKDPARRKYLFNLQV